MRKKLEIGYEVLYDLYILKNYTVSTIAKMYNVCKQTIESRLKEYQIKKPKNLIRALISENNSLKKPEVRRKCEQTNIQRYGVKSVLCLEKYQRLSNTPESRIKASNTRKNNYKNKKPRQEDLVYNKLKLKYPSVIRNYVDKRYPFKCDFYIPELDLFIEYQGFKVHGNEPYDPNNPEHKKILEKWKEKAKTMEFYKKAIETWTIRDPFKRKVAKENGIKLKEIWNKKNRNS